MKFLLAPFIVCLFLSTASAQIVNPPRRDPFQSLKECTVVLRQSYVDQVKDHSPIDSTSLSAVFSFRDTDFFTFKMEGTDERMIILVIPAKEILMIYGKEGFFVLQ